MLIIHVKYIQKLLRFGEVEFKTLYVSGEYLVLNKMQNNVYTLCLKLKKEGTNFIESCFTTFFRMTLALVLFFFFFFDEHLFQLIIKMIEVVYYILFYRVIFPRLNLLEKITFNFNAFGTGVAF